ncbi:MAG: hypothetical protein L6461_22545 [Anaerolineae bacterium]|nr:hypothetical protein [Anaerolineae bacterium]
MMKPFSGKHTWLLFLTALTLLAGLGAAMYDYLGPDRTVTESNVETYDYGVWAKPNYIDPATGECACKKAGQPDVCADGCIVCSWERAPGNACGDATYWYKLGTQSEVVTTTRTYPEASISGALQSCALHNGWCATSPFLSLTANEPVAGHQILLLEGTRNGEIFACASTGCDIPLLEGENTFTYWALSDWGDSSRMGNLSARVDTQPPQIDGAMSGTPGEAGWYVSPVTFSASASDPQPASGIQAFSYALIDGAWTAYTAPVIVGDGAHSIIFRAQDVAGHILEISQAVQVDTLPPQVSGALSGEQINGWYLSQVTFSASAVDTGSGVARIEYSLGGDAWQPYNAPVMIGDGIHSLRTRALDVAGNTVEGETLSFQVDGASPRIQLTESWHIWESGSLQVNDGGSGLAGVEIEIRDPQGRWQKVSRAHETNGQAFATNITWNRKFADGTIAPIGAYQVVIKASDYAGNMSSETASIFIPAPNAPTYPPAPTRTPVTTATGVRVVALMPSATITATRTPVVSTFGLAPPVVSAAQASVPSTSGGQDLWGAAALAAISGATAYALEQQRQRKEEEARQAAEAAQKAASLNAAAAQAKVQNYLQGKAMLEAQLAQSASHHGQDAKLEREEGKEEIAWEAWKDRSQLLAAQRAEVERQRQAQEDANRTYAALREKGQSITVTAPKEKPWWTLPSFSFPEREAKLLAEKIPSIGITNGRKQEPVFKFLAPPSLVSFGAITRYRFTSNANPGAELRIDGIGAGNIYEANQPALMARANFDTGELVAKVRVPSELNFTKGGFSCSAGYSANMYIQWKGIYSTIGADINYADINAKGAGVKGNISKGAYVEVQPAPILAAAALATIVVFTPFDELVALGAAGLKALQEAGRILQPAFER